MEFSKRDKVFSLVFPVITVMYGVIIILSGMYHPLMQRITGFTVIGAGIAVGVLIMVLKINTFPCLKYQTISFVITFGLHYVTANDLVSGGNSFISAFFVLYYIAIDIGSILLMMFKLPKEINTRQRVMVFFADPVLYMLINRLMGELSGLLVKIGVLGS